MKTFNTNEFDIVYMSYDEPRAEEFYADVKSKYPWAKHVHGVKGFDSAHKACANLAETERFITIDGDNIVDESFFNMEFEVQDDITDCVFSWAARNYVNGLVYGNGGLKCWPRQYVLDMRTHENAEADTAAVDFCWDTKYIQFNETYCETFTNGSPFQAFRAGFREGVKMTLDRGVKVSLPNIHSNNSVLWHGNTKRLEIWASVGADVENGLWSVYGTRLGAFMTNMIDWDHDAISDYDWFNVFWKDEISPKFQSNKLNVDMDMYCPYTKYEWSYELLWDATCRLGQPLRRSMGFNVGDLDEEASRFFKHVYVAPSRTGYD
jgi:hypothetical protein